MNYRYLLDTKVVLRWIGEPRKLSREQLHILDDIDRKREQAAVSAVSLLEIATLQHGGRIQTPLETIFQVLRENITFQILPITFEIAEESAALTALRDPADRAIVATALVHRLRLLTSDPRIVDAKLVPVVE